MHSILQNKEILSQVISDSSSIKECLEKLDLRSAGGNYAAFKQACERYGLNIPKYKPTPRQQVPNEEVFKVDSNYSNRGSIKKRLLKDYGFKYQCVHCGLADSWNGKPITLQLEHINGISNDNRLENLCFLCPNCHSQTETYAGKKSRRDKKICKDCKTMISSQATRCRTCYHKLPGNVRNGSKNRPTKIDWPKGLELLELVRSSSYVAVAKTLGVSDKAVAKRLKREGLI